jgi:hypothetical protein
MAVYRRKSTSGLLSVTFLGLGHRDESISPNSKLFQELFLFSVSLQVATTLQTAPHHVIPYCTPAAIYHIHHCRISLGKSMLGTEYPRLTYTDRLSASAAG